MAISISVIFPMFNEEEYIRLVITEVIDVLKDITDNYEVIIVDDASIDESPQIADELSENNSHIKVIHHSQNRKLGGSLRTGFNLASKEIVLYSDMDRPFDLKEVKKAVNLMIEEKADFVSAFRLNSIVRGDGSKRYIYSKIYNSFIRLFFGLRVRDVNFSFKLVKRDLLKQLNLQSEGSFIDAEMLIKAKRCGAKIIQFGTVYLPRLNGSSRLSNISTIIKILQEAFIFRLKFFRDRTKN